MARMKPADLLKRSDRVWKKRFGWDATYRDAYDLAMPQRNLLNMTQEGALKMDRVFDSTLINSTVRFANRWVANNTPPFQDWAEYLPGVDIPADQLVTRAQELQEIRDVVFAGLRVSNFDTANHESVLDLAIGTYALMVHKGTRADPYRFTSVPQTQLALEEGGSVDIGAIFRKHKPQRQTIEMTWKHLGFIKPKGWKEWVEEKPDEDVLVEESTIFDEEKKLYHFDVIIPEYTNSSDEGAVRVVEHDTKISPFIIGRWIKVTGEAHGRGPVLFALPDAKTLNKVMELLLRNAALSVAGVWTARNDGVINPYKVRIVPGAIIVVGSNGTQGANGPSLLLHQMGQNFDLSQILISDLVNKIQKAMLDGELPGTDTGIRSASEFVARMQQAEQDQGSPFARSNREIIIPLHRRLQHIAVELGLVEGKKLMFDGHDAILKLTSPLAQLQNLRNVQNVTDALTIIQSALPQEAVALTMKLENYPGYIFEQMGVDSNLLRDAGERREIEQAQGQQEAIEAQIEQAKRLGGGNGTDPSAAQTVTGASA